MFLIDFARSKLLLVLMVSAQSVESFVFNRGSCQRKIESPLHMGKPLDITDIIKAALSISNKFGVASYQAVLAWKTIEEIEFDKDVKDKVTHGDHNTLQVEEYEDILKELKPLLDEEESKLEKMKSLANEINNIKDIRDNDATNSVRDSIALAREATKKFGLNSTESIAAWEYFDKIADNAALHSQPMTDTECLLEDIEKCIVLEQIQQTFNMTAA